MTEPRRKIFNTYPLVDGITLRNCIVMAPMTTWSANEDGTVSNDEISYYRYRVKGVGLVITGCTHVQMNGIGFTGEFAAHEDNFIPSLRRLAAAAKSGGAPAILQIFHAGNKANPDLTPDGEIVSASALKAPAGPFNGGEKVARALGHTEILEIIAAFGETTRRAIEAGFDGIELHGAHGFLIQNFFSPAFNEREDTWGGSPENRMRFPLAVVREVKCVIAAHAKRPFVLGYRISPEEPDAGGLRIAASLQLIERLIDRGVDYIHASLSDALAATPIDAPEGPTLAQILAGHIGGRVPFIAAGQIRTPEQAERALESGLSMVAIGQGLVMNPDWVELARARHDGQILQSIDAEDAVRKCVPQKLWAIIEALPGWFSVRQPA
jgi:2,4-dienoyl-CoA reductase-like NADH-dependent reductase (Old Yellow Enzyme family)